MQHAQPLHQPNRARKEILEFSDCESSRPNAAHEVVLEF